MMRSFRSFLSLSEGGVLWLSVVCDRSTIIQLISTHDSVWPQNDRIWIPNDPIHDPVLKSSILVVMFYFHTFQAQVMPPRNFPSLSHCFCHDLHRCAVSKFAFFFYLFLIYWHRPSSSCSWDSVVCLAFMSICTARCSVAGRILLGNGANGAVWGCVQNV